MDKVNESALNRLAAMVADGVQRLEEIGGHTEGMELHIAPDVAAQVSTGPRLTSLLGFPVVIDERIRPGEFFLLPPRTP